VGYYLARKVAASSQTTEEGIIQEVDLYRMEPWDLVQVLGGGHGQQEWYFFSYKDRKYPSGTRTNRATAAGFWKATGRDKPVMSRSSSGGSKQQVVIGMRKTLVFYIGRAPHGRKTDWIMHEYRLQSNDINEEHAPAAQEEGWVVCRAFQKPIPNNNNPNNNDLQHMMMMMYPSLGSAGYSYNNHYLGGSSSSSLLYYPPPPAAAVGTTQHDDVESKTKLLMSIPQLIAADGYCQQQPPAGDEFTMVQGGGGQPAAGAAASTIDWNFLDTLLSSTMHP
jgi:hypothetical protein